MGWAIGSTLLGLVIATLFFSDAVLLAATGFTSIGLIFKMNHLLDENRDAIWVHRRSPWEANRILIFKIVAVIGTVFFTTMACQLLAPRSFFVPVAPRELFFANQPLPLFLHNLRVLTACLLLAFIYRSAGILLVICWNGMHWSTSLLTFIQSAPDAGTPGAWLHVAAVIPHLVFEAAAYVTAGMTGVFLSKALFKYKLSSAKFFRVSRACVAILVTSILFLWLAMQFEIGLAQAVMKQLRS